MASALPTATAILLLLITGEVGGTVGVRNCLLSRQQCAEDQACRSILDIIPRVCGPESVACSTVTVNKCLAALRTLQGFPYFTPTCLCREPHLDMECNTFHGFIFDHPCSFIQKSAGPALYTVDALPTCEYALRACGSLPDCIPLYHNFMHACAARNGQCVMTNDEHCLTAWTMLKKSPMFGCICPNSLESNCSNIFNIVHQNPCVDTFPVSSAPYLVGGSGGDGAGGGLWNIMFPPPPPTPRPSQRPPHPRPHPRPHLPPIFPPSPLFPPPHINTPPHDAMDNVHQQLPTSSFHYPHHFLPPPHVTPPQYTALPQPHPPPLYSAQTQNVLSVALPTQSNYPWSSFPVNVIPLVNATGHHHHVAKSPSRGGHQTSHLHNPLVPSPYSPSSRAPGGQPSSRFQNSVTSGSGDGSSSRAASVLGGQPSNSYTLSSAAASSGDPTQSRISPRKQPSDLLMTCHTALQGCMEDFECKRLINGVIAMCNPDPNMCNQEGCMANLQRFYRNVDTKWAMDVAFCLCRKTSHTADQCLTAQETLHPTCARRPTGPMVLCHDLAMSCKKDDSCRHRLEFYEQACAVDSDTQRCAWSSSECRRAVTGILGTELRVMCSCASVTDAIGAYNCVDWQRILWFNPCVVESQTDYHRQMIQNNAGVELTTHPSIVMPPRLTTEILSEPVQHGKGSSQQAQHGGTVIVPGPTVSGAGSWTPKTTQTTSTTTTTTTRRPTTTTIPPNYCEKHYSGRSGAQDRIPEGDGKRYYTVQDPNCSELCLCHPDKQLVCNVLPCVDPNPCETKVAIYNHAAPAFLAFRGDCLCYSGYFICVRPHTTIQEKGVETQAMYEPGKGVYLFIGFSQAEEELLHPYTHFSVIHTIPKLQAMLEEAAYTLNESYCVLTLHEQLRQNIILQVTLPELDEHRDNMTAAMYKKEKEGCVDSLEIVADKINSQHEDVRGDIALSMLMLAEVYVDVPVVSAATRHLSPSVLLSLLCSGWWLVTLSSRSSTVLLLLDT